MGTAGSGKTKFIADLLNQPDLSNDNSGLTAGTKSIIAHSLHISGRHVHLLDTPGFDNTHLDDAGVVNQVKRYIEQRSILDGLPNTLSGIVYLHRISSPRFSGSSVGALAALKTLCGGNAGASRIQFLTTFWDEVQEHDGRSREADLRSVSTILKDLLDKGSTLQRTPDSALGKKAVLAAILTSGDQIEMPSVHLAKVPRPWPELSSEVASNISLPSRNKAAMENGVESYIARPISPKAGRHNLATSDVSVNTRSLSPLPPSFEQERAALALREDSLKCREDMVRVRELALTSDIERQRLGTIAEHAGMQKTFEQRLSKERAAFQSALSTERNHRTELDAQIRVLRSLHHAQAKMCEAKDRELEAMSKTVADAIFLADRQKQDRLRTIGADHETMMHFHLYRDLSEIVALFCVSLTVEYSKGNKTLMTEEFASEFKKSEQVTETCFDNMTPCCHPVAYLTQGTWQGFYFREPVNPDGSGLGPMMRGIKFHAAPISTRDSGLYEVWAVNCRDDAGAYSISGTFDVSQAHNNGRMILRATKEYTTHSWHWDLRAGPHGLLGLWDAEKDREKVKRFWGAKHSCPGQWDGIGGIYLMKAE